MTSWLRRYRTPIFAGTLLIFFGGVFAGLGGYYLGGGATAEAVARIDGAQIPYMRFQVRANQIVESLRAQGRELDEASLKSVRQETLRDMIVEEILAGQAERMGIVVTDRELAMGIRAIPRFQRDGVFDQGLYFQTVASMLRTTPEDFERQQRRALLAFKLQRFILDAVKVSPEEARAEWSREKGSERGYDKEADAWRQELHRRRGLDLINAVFLRQILPQVRVENYLERRDEGR